MLFTHEKNKNMSVHLGTLWKTISEQLECLSKLCLLGEAFNFLLSRHTKKEMHCEHHVSGRVEHLCWGQHSEWVSTRPWQYCTKSSELSRDSVQVSKEPNQAVCLGSKVSFPSSWALPHTSLPLTSMPHHFPKWSPTSVVFKQNENSVSTVLTVLKST